MSVPHLAAGLGNMTPRTAVIGGPGHLDLGRESRYWRPSARHPAPQAYSRRESLHQWRRTKPDVVGELWPSSLAETLGAGSPGRDGWGADVENHGSCHTGTDPWQSRLTDGAERGIWKNRVLEAAGVRVIILVTVFFGSKKKRWCPSPVALLVRWQGSGNDHSGDQVAAGVLVSHRGRVCSELVWAFQLSTLHACPGPKSERDHLAQPPLARVPAQTGWVKTARNSTGLDCGAGGYGGHS